MTFAFECWYDGSEIRTSDLYCGNSAEIFALRSVQNGNFSNIHYGGSEVCDLYHKIHEKIQYEIDLRLSEEA